jgi:Spirocyclase AveC-like
LSYFGMATSGAWTATLTMAKVKARWPRVSNTSLIVVGLVTGMLLDWIYEHTLISFQLMSYMGVVPELTLGFGTIYQFPLYEAVFFGGVVGFTGVIWYFKDDRGFTLAERGVEKLQLARSKGLKTFVRFLALVGLLQCALFFFYSLPMQLFSVNAAPFPDDVPSYLRNGVCGPGTPYECATMQRRPRDKGEPSRGPEPSSGRNEAH